MSTEIYKLLSIIALYIVMHVEKVQVPFKKQTEWRKKQLYNNLMVQTIDL